MSDVTAESVRATLASYEAAMAKVFAISPAVQFEGTGGGIDLFLPRTVRVRGASEEFAAHATEISTQCESLMEGYGESRRAKHITPGMWTWRSDFFKVRAYARTPFEYFGWEPRQVWYSEGDGEETVEEAHLHGREVSIRVLLVDRSFGLQYWRKNADEARRLMDAAPAEIREKYRKAYHEADVAVQEWDDLRRAPSVGLEFA